ncbi:MBOAT, membrane-bound O-acyltransferase family-domain-containing protein [Dipodascopsis uninucleata]
MIQLIDYGVSLVAKPAGLPTDPLKLVLTLLLSYPFCAILKRLPDDNPFYKRLFCINVSAFYLLGVFDLKAGLMTLLYSSLGTYGLAKYVKNGFMPWIVFIFTMGHLLFSHLERIFGESIGDQIDITGAQMVLVMKLTTFAWNVHDGRQPESTLTALQKDRALKSLPSLLDFLSYVFFFPSMMIGPSYDYSEFSRWLDLSMFDGPELQKLGKKRKRKIPRSGRVAARKALEGVFWLALWIILDDKLNAKYLLSDKFVRLNIMYRILYLWPLGFVYRLKYYGAWSLAEGSCILSGLGYNGKGPDGKLKWDRVKNIDIWRFETGQNIHVLLESWNMNTNKWLKTYVYLRVTPKGQKPGFRSTLLTFLTSAFWHGVNPGYYLTFVTGAFMQSCGRSARRYIRPFFLKPDLSGDGPYKKYYDIVCYVMTQLFMGYAVQPFILLTFKQSIIAWSRVYFYAHVVLLGTIITFSRKDVRKFMEKKLSARNIEKSSSKLSNIRFEVEQARSKRTKQELEDAEIQSRQLLHEPSMGIPDDEINDELLDEMRKEFKSDLIELRGDLEDFRRRAKAASLTDGH